MATRVKIEPGICKLTCVVDAELVDDDEVKVSVATGCEAIKSMMTELGDTFGTFETVLQKPGVGPFYEYASQKFPLHSSCPAINGILKAMEVEGGLALRCDAHITFE